MLKQISETVKERNLLLSLFLDYWLSTESIEKEEFDNFSGYCFFNKIDQFILSICLSIIWSSCDSYLNNEEEWSFVSTEKLTGKWTEIRIKGDDETMSLFITDD